MRRGEVWTVAGGRGYAGKPRPAVILQDDRFDATASVTLCAFTADPTAAPLWSRIGRLDDEDVLRLNRAVLVFLSLAGPGTRS